MGTVTISGTVFNVYGTTAGALDYHKPSLDDAGIAFSAATQAIRDSSLVEATRMIDRQRWQGAPTAAYPSPQPLKFPRTGLVDEDGVAVSSLVVPVLVETAAYELAAMMYANPDLKSEWTSGSNIASLGAGPAQVSFFRPTLGQTGRFPTIIMELLARWLAGNVAGQNSEAFGTDGESAFDNADGYTLVGAI